MYSSREINKVLGLTAYCAWQHSRVEADGGLSNERQLNRLWHDLLKLFEDLDVAVAATDADDPRDCLALHLRFNILDFELEY